MIDRTKPKQNPELLPKYIYTLDMEEHPEENEVWYLAHEKKYTVQQFQELVAISRNQSERLGRGGSPLKLAVSIVNLLKSHGFVDVDDYAICHVGMRGKNHG